MNKEEALYWFRAGAQMVMDDDYGPGGSDFSEEWAWYERNKDGGYLKRVENMRKEIVFKKQPVVCYACGSDKGIIYTDWQQPYRYYCQECRDVFNE